MSIEYLNPEDRYDIEVFNRNFKEIEQRINDIEAKSTGRPSDWLTMPMPEDNEIYLLLHVPDGLSGLIAFGVDGNGMFTIEAGTVVDGVFVPQTTTQQHENGQGYITYQNEFFSEDYGDLTSDGFKQVMIRISGEEIFGWVPATYEKNGSYTTSNTWNIVEIACKLPHGITFDCGSLSSGLALKALRYFAWYGENDLISARSMFANCSSFIEVLALDTSKVVDFSSCFQNCNLLIAPQRIDTSKGKYFASMYSGSGLLSVQELDLSGAENDTENDTQYVDYKSIFQSCSNLKTISGIKFSKNAILTASFQYCYSLISTGTLVINTATSNTGTFSRCYSLASIKLDPDVTNADGVNIYLTGCMLSHKAIVELFESLPTISESKIVSLQDNPGVTDLTDAEKAIATQKGWTLLL